MTETPPPCEHPEVEAFVDVVRLTETDDGPVTAFSASVRVYCGSCAEPFVWTGAPVGLSPRQPMTSVDGQELRAPLRPRSAPEGFGETGPGFSVRVGG